MVKEIVSPADFKNIQTFDSPIDEQSFSLAKDLKDTLRYCWSQGRISKSISSNQIGSSRRAIAVADKRGGKIEVMFNPKISIPRGEQEFWEDNLIAPLKMTKVERFDHILLSFVAEDGREKSYHCYGEKAALVQQEIDNLDGILPCERGLLEADVGLKDPDSKFLEEINI